MEDEHHEHDPEHPDPASLDAPDDHEVYVGAGVKTLQRRVWGSGSAWFLLAFPGEAPRWFRSINVDRGEYNPRAKEK
jgi:hypothetical protein